MITRWPYPRHGDTPDKINNSCQTRADRLNAKLKHYPTPYLTPTVPRGSGCLARQLAELARAAAPTTCIHASGRRRPASSATGGLSGAGWGTMRVWDCGIGARPWSFIGSTGATRSRSGEGGPSVF